MCTQPFPHDCTSKNGPKCRFRPQFVGVYQSVTMKAEGCIYERRVDPRSKSAAYVALLPILPCSAGCCWLSSCCCCCCCCIRRNSPVQAGARCRRRNSAAGRWCPLLHGRCSRLRFCTGRPRRVKPEEEKRCSSAAGAAIRQNPSYARHTHAGRPAATIPRPSSLNFSMLCNMEFGHVPTFSVFK